MRKQNSRISLRMESKTKSQIESLVGTGRNRSLSEVIRKAVNEFLSKLEQES